MLQPVLATLNSPIELLSLPVILKLETQGRAKFEYFIFTVIITFFR